MIKLFCAYVFLLVIINVSNVFAEEIKINRNELCYNIGNNIGNNINTIDCLAIKINRDELCYNIGNNINTISCLVINLDKIILNNKLLSPRTTSNEKKIRCLEEKQILLSGPFEGDGHGLAFDTDEDKDAMLKRYNDLLNDEWSNNPSLFVNLEIPDIKYLDFLRREAEYPNIDLSNIYITEIYTKYSNGSRVLYPYITLILEKKDKNNFRLIYINLPM